MEDVQQSLQFENKDKILEYQKQYHQENKERVSEKYKVWY